MTAPICPLSFQHGSALNVPKPTPRSPRSLGDSLANDRLANATQTALRNAQVRAGIVVFVSAMRREPSRSYVIDVDGHSPAQATLGSIADRLASLLDKRVSADIVQKYFESMVSEHQAPGESGAELATFTVDAEAGSLVFLLQAVSISPDWRVRIEDHLQIVAPLLAELAGAEQTKQRASRRLGLLESALDEMSVAVFMLDTHARPFCLNAAAFGRLAMADAFRLKRNGVLSCVTPRDTVALHEAVRRIADATTRDMHEEPLLIATRDGERIMATLRSVSAEASGLDNRAALLMVQHEVRLSRAALDALGLTASEQRFLSSFLYCSSLASAAERLNLSDETARTYLKRICAKLGVRKQAELVALIWNLSLPLRRQPDSADDTAPGALGRINNCQSPVK